MDSEYKSDNESESSKESAVYSTGFFLLKHEVAYPKDNVLTFYSLYRHTAKLSDYKSGIEELVGITKSADNKIVIRDAQNQPLNPRVELKNGVTIGVRRHTQTQDKFDELLWYRETKDNKTIEHKPKSGEHWRIFHQSYEEMQSEPIKGLPLLSKHKVDTQADIEVKLDKPIEIKAGEVLGLMGEYNQIGESGEVLLLHGRKIIKKSVEYLKKDLVNNPELVLDQKNATKIMIYGMETGMFTTKYQVIFQKIVLTT